MRTLGRRTGELHVALARTTGDPAFDPEPITQADVDAWSKQMRDDAQRSLDQLAARRAAINESQRELAERILAARGMLLERFGRMAENGIAAAKTRFHGDYHLGQVLLSNNDFIIIDFEGEPSRTLEERRRKDSPLKDVAGMLRSFSYVGASALALATVERAELRSRLETVVAEWERATAAAFLAAYEEAAAPAVSFPADAQQRAEAIDCFKLEKAFYELRYELGNRPEWIGIPLAGLSALIDEPRVLAEAEA
jgi:maltose alpha-D-glucosyltransferase/alpha-amylase